MIKKLESLLFLCFLLSTNVLANTNQQIEVFDCQKKWSFKNTFRSSYSKKAVQFAKSITGCSKLKCRSKRWSHDKNPFI